MEFCPVCKSEITAETETCTACNAKIENYGENNWVMIGSVEDKISSDYAEETLKSYNIPVVVISNSGFFGTAGLALNPFHGSSQGMFEISVPDEFIEEAVGILDMILSSSWVKKDK